MTTKDAKTPPPRRAAILLSAFVFPGAGQFLQQRRVAGLIFACPFVLLLVGFLASAGMIIAAPYRMALEFDTYEPGPLPYRQAVIFVAGAAVVYLGSFCDVTLAYFRALRAMRISLSD